jgi:hypothetical protein
MFKGNNKPINNNGKRVLEGDVHWKKNLILKKQTEYAKCYFSKP